MQNATLHTLKHDFITFYFIMYDKYIISKRIKSNFAVFTNISPHLAICIKKRYDKTQQKDSKRIDFKNGE